MVQLLTRERTVRMKGKGGWPADGTVKPEEMKGDCR